MTSFQQCKACGTFLLASRALTGTLHHTGQCHSSSEGNLGLNNETYTIDKSEDDKFGNIKFPHLRIRLSRVTVPSSSAHSESELSNFEVNAKESRIQRRKRKRKEDPKVGTSVSNKRKTEESGDDEKIENEGPKNESQQRRKRKRYPTVGTSASNKRKSEESGDDEKIKDEGPKKESQDGMQQRRKRKRYPTVGTSASNKRKTEESGDDEKMDEGGPLIRAYRFDCKQCPGKFYSTVEFKRHMNVHNGSRRLMTCIVCLRMFNKRDSLNQHYAAHENAEEREVNLNLMNSWPKNVSENRYTRVRQGCKYCLLMHTNQASFVNHIRTEHGDAPADFLCRLDNCVEKFSTIKDLLHHAKEHHPVSFYGKFTHNKIKGLSVPRCGKSNGPSTSQQLKPENPDKVEVKTSTTVKKQGSCKRRKRKVSFESDSDDEIFNFIGTGTRTRNNLSHEEACDRTVELERVHIVEGTGESNYRTDVHVKKENSKFYSSYQEVRDPFFMYEFTNQMQSTLAPTSERKLIMTTEQDALSSTDSVPVVLGIKREPI